MLTNVALEVAELLILLGLEGAMVGDKGGVGVAIGVGVG